MTKPLFLYLPHQAVHVGNPTEPSHPEYAPDQAPQEYIDRYSWVADEARRNLSAMVAVMVRQLRRAHVDIIWTSFGVLSPFSFLLSPAVIGSIPPHTTGVTGAMCVGYR